MRGNWDNMTLDYFDTEWVLQKLAKNYLLKNNVISQVLYDGVIARAGLHSCFKKNLYRAYGPNLNLSSTSQVWNNFDLLKCQNICLNKTRLKVVLYYLAFILNLLSINYFKPQFKPNIFIISTPNVKNDLKLVKEFIFQKRISKFLIKSKKIILVQRQVFSLNFFSKDIRSTLYVPFFLIRNLTNLNDRISLLKIVSKNLLKFFRMSQDSLISRIYKEFLLEESLYTLIKLDNEIDIIYTQSNLRKLIPLSYINSQNYKKKNIMAWYSINNNIISEINKQTLPISDIYLSLQTIDLHLVWDKQMVSEITKLTKKPIFDVGSLLFYPRPNMAKQSNYKILKNKKSIKVLFFDIAPQRKLGNNFFYNEKNMILTLTDIVASIQVIKKKHRLKLELFIKPKRNYSFKYSRKYIRLVLKLILSRKIKLISSKVNLYSLISESDLVISLPWSSPGVIATELGTHNVYYVSDPDRNWKLDNPRNAILLNDQKALQEWLLYCFKNLI